MDILHNILFALFPLAVAYGAVSDIATMTIPNRLIVALVAGFVLMALVAGIDLDTFALHWLAGFIVLALAFGCFAAGWIGGGDAKFAAAIVLWLGLDRTLEFLLLSAIFGGMLTLAILIFRRRMLPAFAIRQMWLFRLHDPASGVPYGVALAAAALLIYPKTGWMVLATG